MKKYPETYTISCNKWVLEYEYGWWKVSKNNSHETARRSYIEAKQYIYKNEGIEPDYKGSINEMDNS